MTVTKDSFHDFDRVLSHEQNTPLKYGNITFCYAAYNQNKRNEPWNYAQMHDDFMVQRHRNNLYHMPSIGTNFSFVNE
ncbi:hypothetical protein HMPREF1985_00822 [Mitsuokella sp. oral taxon 131 str. W9106]|nr:hypothetical protein HMPREF1985_00822 [Mitsuokella sp. oral taxon 131 str. W9106]